MEEDLFGSELARAERRDKRAAARARTGMRTGAAKLFVQIAESRDKREAQLLRRAEARRFEKRRRAAARERNEGSVEA